MKAPLTRKCSTASRIRASQAAGPLPSLATRAVLSLVLALGTVRAASEGLHTVTLAAGTALELRLETPVSTKVSHLNGAIAARVVREVPGEQKVAIPLAAMARGRLEKLIPSSSPSDRARVLMQFTRLEIPGQPPLPLIGRVRQVENAREVVLKDGTIQGVLADELPLRRLEDAMAKLGRNAGGVGKITESALGKSDTSIDYPAGTEFEFVLDQALTVRGGFEPAVPGVLLAGTGPAVDRLLSEAPQRAAGKDNAPGDPLNLVMVGCEAEIKKAFEEAGWTEAARQGSNSIWRTVRAVIADQGYGAAPVSHLYLYGRAEDLAFEKMLNTFAKRHHLRLWRSPVQTPEGREIWLGAATHDSGLDVRPGVVSHAIDPDLDAERSKVGADLKATGRVAGETFEVRLNPLHEGLTATGAPWKTDGRILAVELKAQ